MAAVERHQAAARGVRQPVGDAPAGAEPAALPPPDPGAEAASSPTRGCTVLLLDDRSADDGDLQLHSIAHGVISLEQVGRPVRPGAAAACASIKMRGIKFRGGDHDFDLDTGGLAVFPRLVAAEHRARLRRRRSVSTGAPELDALLGGGLARGTNTLFSGPVGRRQDHHRDRLRAGGAASAASRPSYYLFDEGLGTLLLRCKALGHGPRSPIIDERPAARSSRSTRPKSRPASSRNMVRDAVRERRRADRRDRQPERLPAGHAGRASSCCCRCTSC